MQMCDTDVFMYVSMCIGLGTLYLDPTLPQESIAVELFSQAFSVLGQQEGRPVYGTLQ